MQFGWDEYRKNAAHETDRWAISDRGWAALTEGHPNGPGEHTTCGWYLHYDAHDHYEDRGILAAAYLLKPYGGTLMDLGSCWHQTIDAAKAWIEERITSYLM